MKYRELTIIGGGLAGSEAAWQAAERGIQVDLYEMRPFHSTGAHKGSNLAELVCSNSLGHKESNRASGLLIKELELLDSLLIRCAFETALPAGAALAVDRDAFSTRVTNILEEHPNIRIIREEVTEIPDTPVIISSGPLTSNKLVQAIQKFTGEENLSFFDAISPIIEVNSVDLTIAFHDSRYNRGTLKQGDYINCPLNRDQYEIFVQELVNAETIQLLDFEEAIRNGVRAGMHQFFEGCLPIEILAAREQKALAFGPMSPVGLRNPHTREYSYAVVQLRQDNLIGTLYNMVGFQTNLKINEQKRIFRLIPGLEKAEFTRFGHMHRNTFIFSPGHLNNSLQALERKNLFFAGQISGIEGYLGNIATGLLAGMNAARVIRGEVPVEFPRTTMIGALCSYIASAKREDYQPMKANFGILAKLDGDIQKGKQLRGELYAERSQYFLNGYLSKLECH